MQINKNEVPYTVTLADVLKWMDDDMRSQGYVRVNIESPIEAIRKALGDKSITQSPIVFVGQCKPAERSATRSTTDPYEGRGGPGDR